LAATSRRKLPKSSREVNEEMNDFNDGLVEGVMIALLVAERHKRNPKLIQGELVKMLQQVGSNVANNAIDRIASQAKFWSRNH
jgi:hypothetical protein